MSYQTAIWPKLPPERVQTIRFYACESSSIIYGHNQVILTLCFEFLPPKPSQNCYRMAYISNENAKKKILFSRDLPVFNIISAKVSEQNG